MEYTSNINNFTRICIPPLDRFYRRNDFARVLFAVSIRPLSMNSIKLMIKLHHQNDEWKESSRLVGCAFFFLLLLFKTFELRFDFLPTTITNKKWNLLKARNFFARFHFGVVSFSVSSSRFITTVWQFIFMLQRYAILFVLFNSLAF